MKRVLFITAFVVSLSLYITGFFVSEKQYIEETSSGQIVLSDAEMAQLVGGPFMENWTNYKKHDKKGHPPYCWVNPDDCNTRIKVRVTSELWGCEPCADRNWRIRFNNIKIDYKVDHFCILRSDGCKPRHKVNSRKDSCVDDLGFCP